MATDRGQVLRDHVVPQDSRTETIREAQEVFLPCLDKFLSDFLPWTSDPSDEQEAMDQVRALRGLELLISSGKVATMLDTMIDKTAKDFGLYGLAKKEKARKRGKMVSANGAKAAIAGNRIAQQSNQAADSFQAAERKRMMDRQNELAVDCPPREFRANGTVRII